MEVCREICKKFGQMIKNRRKEKAMTQETLAEICNLSVREISDIESGKTNPKLDTILRLCMACGIDTGELPCVITEEASAGSQEQNQEQEREPEYEYDTPLKVR